jgi:ribosome recycling factor
MPLELAAPQQPFVYSRVVPTMVRETWTDERLDDLTKRVDEGFRESRADLRQFRQEVRSDMDRRFNEVDKRFDKVEAKFDSLQRMLLGGFFTVVVSVLLTRI